MVVCMNMNGRIFTGAWETSGGYITKENDILQQPLAAKNSSLPTTLPSHAVMLMDSSLCTSCGNSHSCREFLCVMAVPCPEDSSSLHLSSSSGSHTPSSPSSISSLSLGMVAIDAPFRTKQSTVSLFLSLIKYSDKLWVSVSTVPIGEKRFSDEDRVHASMGIKTGM